MPNTGKKSLNRLRIKIRTVRRDLPSRLTGASAPAPNFRSDSRFAPDPHCRSHSATVIILNQNTTVVLFWRQVRTGSEATVRRLVTPERKHQMPGRQVPMEVKEILESYGVRFGIEEAFKDIPLKV